ncbi:MAG: murein biosynthesis integral membrane protein MurJ [Peptoniphilaceae bacterium]|nr:murein biosynthesis integral membrane protein MurJ [Peptoniphilaceae bacterium]MDY6018686.1 murein biosynthesis integral membrane protein MurJ [Anaerococcus sp.]
MGQTAFMLMFVTIISKVFGFAREAVMAYFYGDGPITASYTVANTLPVILANLVANGIIFGFIPMYNRVKNEEGEEESEKFTSNIFNILLIIAIVAVVIGMIFAKAFALIFSPSLAEDPKNLKMAVTFTRIIMFAIFAYFYSAVYRGYLNMKGNFIIPATTGIIMNVIIIVFIIASGLGKNPYILAIGCLAGNVLQYVLFPKTARDLGYKHRWSLDFHNKYVKMLMLISIPVIVSAAAGEIALTVDNTMASYYFGHNTIGVLRYAKQLLALITGIITVSVTTSIFPTISYLGQKGKFEMMKANISSAIVLTMLLVIPSTIGMMALAEPIVSVVFGRGKFDENAITVTASMVIAYAPYVIFQSFSDVIDKGFYSVGDSKTPVIVVVIQQIVNIILNFILIKFFALPGLAYATSLSCLIGAIFMSIRFRQNFGRMRLKTTIISLAKITILSIIMGLLANKLCGMMNERLGNFISILITVIVSVIFYAFFILVARIPEVMSMVNKFYHKHMKKNK